MLGVLRMDVIRSPNMQLEYHLFLVSRSIVVSSRRRCMRGLDCTKHFAGTSVSFYAVAYDIVYLVYIRHPLYLVHQDLHISLHPPETSTICRHTLQQPSSRKFVKQCELFSPRNTALNDMRIFAICQTATHPLPYRSAYRQKASRLSRFFFAPSCPSCTPGPSSTCTTPP